MEILIFAALIGLVPAAIAQHKGYNFVLWWFFGAFLFVVALPVILLVKSKGVKQCPFCAEPIKTEASVCKHCGRELNQSDEENQSDSILIVEIMMLVAIVGTIFVGATSALGKRTQMTFHNVADMLANPQVDPEAILENTYEGKEFGVVSAAFGAWVLGTKIGEIMDRSATAPYEEERKRFYDSLNQ